MRLIDSLTERMRHPALTETDIYVVKTMIDAGSSTCEIAETFGYTERQVETVANADSRDALVS